MEERPRRCEEGWRLFVKVHGGAWMDGLGAAAPVGEDPVDVLGASVQDRIFFLA